jgi:CheY-like chemotaxis protein
MLVLIVDDDPDLRSLASLGLSLDRTIRSEQCESGEAALARVTRAPIPDVVLLDVEMPGLGGIETAMRLVGQNIPVVLLTGRERGIDAAALGVKPFDPMKLAKELRAVLGA